MSLIWIDNSDVTWFSEDATINAQVGDGGSNDTNYSAKSNTDMFYTQTSVSDFSVQFISDGTPQADSLRVSFIDEVRVTAERFRPDAHFDTLPDTILDKNYTLTSTQYWKDGSLAPAYYYDSININEKINEYSAGPEATNYVSIYDDIIEENDERRTIRVTAPQYIESFKREFKKLLNE